MGFDADAFVPDGRCITTDPVLFAAFTQAANKVVQLAGGRDGFLHLSSLDCGHAIGFMEQALGHRCGPDAGIWSPEDVRRLWDAAQWPDPTSVRADQLSDYWSARIFVEVCVEQSLGIWFN